MHHRAISLSSSMLCTVVHISIIIDIFNNIRGILLVASFISIIQYILYYKICFNIDIRIIYLCLTVCVCWYSNVSILTHISTIYIY